MHAAPSGWDSPDWAEQAGALFSPKCSWHTLRCGRNRGGGHVPSVPLPISFRDRQQRLLCQVTGLMEKCSLEGSSRGNLLPWVGQTWQFSEVAQVLRHSSNFCNLERKEQSEHRPQTYVGQNTQPEDCQNIYLVIQWSWRKSDIADILYFCGLCHSFSIR